MPRATYPGRAVLLVDDEPLLLKSIERLFESRGFAVLTAADAPSALGLSRHTERLDLLVTDVFLPGIDGVALAVAMGATWPGLPVLFISGLEAGPIGDDLPSGQRWAFLAKPFSGGELDSCLAVLLGPEGSGAPVRRE